MKKILSALLIAILLISSTTVAFAAPADAAVSARASTAWTTHAAHRTQAPASAVIYEKTFTLTQKGGIVKAGFVTLQFPRNSLPADQLPRQLTVQVFASGNTGVVSVTPDTEGFRTPVRITVSAYRGWLYDELLGANRFVRYAPTTFYVDHFSRYCWH